MKVLLINSKALHAKHKAAMPLGLLSIAKYLTDNGHTVKLYDRAVETYGLKKYLDSFCPDFVGISVLSVKRFRDAINLSKTIKARNIPVVWGGQIPSAIPELVLKSGVVDYVVVGEGETTFLELLNAVSEKTPLRDINGLAFLEDGEPVVNKGRAFADLAELPVLDFSFVDPEKYFISYINCKKMLHLYASKGCPCKCYYCYNHCFHKHLWRARPTEYFLSEIKYLVENHGMDGVCFVDDLFGPNQEYVKDVCEKIIQSNINFVWGCNMRSDTCNKEELQLMYKAGCRWILFGIESGSKERQKIIGKNLDLDKTKEVVNYCRKIGIFVSSTFILGYPDETEEELKETIKYMLEINTNTKYPNFIGVLPKSELYEKMVKIGRLEIPRSYMQWEKLKMWDQLGKNYSRIPDKELKVVSACFSWWDLFIKYPNPDDGKESRVIFKRAVLQTLDIFKRGTFYSMRLLIIAAKELIQIFFYAKLFPEIRKKYGLQ